MAMRMQHAEEGITETHEINVTPFIDVMLVLLVIFMVTAPLSTVDVPVNLPASNASQQLPEQQPVFLTLQADLSIAIGNDHIDRSQVGSALENATHGNHDTQIFLRADQSVDYQHLMDLLNVLRDAGYLKVALVGLGSGPAGA
jgi:biopolymer transport protein ExbD